MTHWRILVHALDRTGPPMLARAFLRWAVRNRPDDAFDVVAFRGGELIDSMIDLAPVRIVLDPSEPWDGTPQSDGPPRRLARRLSSLAPADATLLVSVSAAQILPLLADDGPRVVWAVEQGQDLHWIEDSDVLLEETDRWLAGSAGTAQALSDRLRPIRQESDPPPITVCREFVERPPSVSSQVLTNCRAALGAGDDDLLVIGAGIGTFRKGIDVFLEIAAAASRRGLPSIQFVWIGGEHDDLYWRVREQTTRLGMRNLRWFGNVTDVDPWFQAADVFLQSARLDAFPLVCLHAALGATPTISFAGAGGVEEMFGDAFLGRPYPDVEGIVDLLELLASPDERRHHGEAQRAVVTDRFTSDVAASAVMGELEAAARSHTSKAAVR